VENFAHHHEEKRSTKSEEIFRKKKNHRKILHVKKDSVIRMGFKGNTVGGWLARNTLARGKKRGNFRSKVGDTRKNRAAAKTTTPK